MAEPLRLRHRLLALAAGALLVPAFAPWQWLILLWPAFLALWLLLQRFPQHGFQLGYCFGLGLFLAGVPWVYTSLHDFGGLLAPLAILLTVLFAAFLALFPALATTLFCRLQARPAMAALGFAACWTLLEWVRSWAFTGFPWLSLGYVLSDTPLRWLFSLGGTWLASLVTVVLALLPAVLWQTRRFSPLLLPLFLLLVFTSLAVLQPRTQPSDQTLRVALLQGNYSQDIKWDPEWIPREVAWYTQTTLQQDADLVLWPETAIPGSNVAYSESLQALDQIMARRQQGVLVGIIDRQGNSLYNALLGLGTLKGSYHKQHLVLLGEYFPFRDWLKLLPGLVIPANDFTHGQEDQPPLRLGEITLLANICYEDVFGSEMRQRLLQYPQTGVLINASNDAWFGRTAPWQHLQMARMRAVELGRPLLRVTNTGITAIIAPDGQIQAKLPPFEQSVLQARITGYQGKTVFLQYGSFWVHLLSILLLALAFRPRKINASDAKTRQD